MDVVLFVTFSLGLCVPTNTERTSFVCAGCPGDVAFGGNVLGQCFFVLHTRSPHTKPAGAVITANVESSDAPCRFVVLSECLQA